MLAGTGFPRSDVENDFLRARRRQVLAALRRRLRREPSELSLVLPIDDVIGALSRRGQRYLGLQTIRLDTIVGSAGLRRDFDRRFRPTSNRVRSRWEQLALAQRRGAPIPPIEVYRMGAAHFVNDGHHRVSIAAATGQREIDAYVTEILTAAPATALRSVSDLSGRRPRYLRPRRPRLVTRAAGIPRRRRGGRCLPGGAPTPPARRTADRRGRDRG
jgi:hypothetical protein